MPKTSPWELWTLNFELSMSVLVEVEAEVREQGLEMKEFFLLGKLDDHPTLLSWRARCSCPRPRSRSW